MVFLQLSDLAAAQAEHLNISQGSFEALRHSRNRLRDLSSRMVRYTLSMTSNDCGGITEYSEFFTSLRVVFGIPELREELSGELKDVLALLESGYLEEEKRQRDFEEEKRQEKYQIQQNLKRERDRKARQFEVILSIFGSLSVPFAVVSGIFGMNLKNLPSDVDFWTLIGITFVVSFLMLATFSFVRFYKRID